MTTKEILTQAVTAKNAINSADTETKNKALANMADALLAHTDAILEANKQYLRKQQEERFLMS